jgi:hypothetical protein
VPSGAEGTSPAGRSVAGASTASTIAYWAIGASDYCPSKKETIALQVVAANSQGSLITGNYASKFILSDTDKSGATKLSATTVTKGNQVVNLTFSGANVGAFKIQATVGNATGYASFYPRGTCINSNPSVIVVHDSAAATFVTLSGAAGPYEIQNPSSGSGCGSAVTIKRRSATEFGLTSATKQFGYCYVQPKNKTIAGYTSVIILKS